MIQTYRRRPETIEGEQWFPGAEIEGVVVKPNHIGGRGHGRIALPDQPYFESDGLSTPLYPGDYITRSGAGRGVMRRDYFEGLYELVQTEPVCTCHAKDGNHSQHCPLDPDYEPLALLSE